MMQKPNVPLGGGIGVRLQEAGWGATVAACQPWGALGSVRLWFT